jgi:hypothetical protein
MSINIVKIMFKEEKERQKKENSLPYYGAISLFL